ncbi:saccharopine dehydrogenase C-terminal domain-containing protein [Sorangium sp. So ce448]|uniref:saccharopine dehydrogenase family protein n=1 Tax=Sorangium sp. So ce448 TaxID=3133314 RepID=UPI003F6160AF
MKILVLGASGKMGSAVAWDLARAPEVKQIGLLGRRREALEQTRRFIGAGNLICHAVDAADLRAAREAMKGYDAGALALPDRRMSYRIVQTAIEAGLPIVDMLEEYHRTPDAHETERIEVPAGMSLARYGEWLHEEAVARGVPFIDGMGFSPGLANITVGDGIKKLDRAVSAVARVGGIPEKSAAERRPLSYMITWAFHHVLREYMVKVLLRRGGEVVEVEAGTSREQLRFERFGKHEVLECAVTPGMASFITSRPELQDFAVKTVRWPGHWAGVQTLKECGLLDLTPVAFQGRDIVPREFLHSLLVPRLRAGEGDQDVCVMANTVHGTKDGEAATVEHFMWVESGDGLSAMARATGFPVAIAARLLASGRIRRAGILPPEDCIHGELYRWFLGELEERGIRIEEVVSWGAAPPPASRAA